jgi:hypothetical protein
VAVRSGEGLLRPLEDPQGFLESELLTPKLNKIHNHLWLAGLARPARPLHRQYLMNRTVCVTESPDEHLVWEESRIFIKPLPEFLLSYDFWQDELCAGEELHESACGLLLSYVWLISHKSDFNIAKEKGLIAEEIQWLNWTEFANELLNRIDITTLRGVNRRYRFGELRLSRLNLLYKFVPSVFSTRHFVFGFMTSSTWYRAFFRRNFAWALALFAYITVVLSAMQVGLATERLQSDRHFQMVSSGFTIASVVAVTCVIGMMLLVWVVLFCYHMFSAIQYTKHAHKRYESDDDLPLKSGL